VCISALNIYKQKEIINSINKQTLLGQPPHINSICSQSSVHFLEHMLLDLNAFKSIKIKLNLYRAFSHSLLSQLSSFPADRQSGEP